MSFEQPFPTDGVVPDVSDKNTVIAPPPDSQISTLFILAVTYFISADACQDSSKKKQIGRVKNFIITPIAAHNLNVRPVVVPDDSVLRLTVEGRDSQFLASLDSRSEPIDASTELIIKRAPFEVNLIRLEHQNFLNTMRNKLMWGLDRRN